VEKGGRADVSESLFDTHTLHTHMSSSVVALVEGIVVVIVVVEVVIVVGVVEESGRRTGDTMPMEVAAANTILRTEDHQHRPLHSQDHQYSHQPQP
jgi:hypothetical protein